MPIDTEVRSAAFAFVQQLRGRFGDRIPRDALMEGIMVRGERVPIWNRYRGIHKPGILGPDGAALTVQTSVDTPYDDTHDEASGTFGYKYCGEDPNFSDNRALRQAMVAQQPLIYLVAVDPNFYDAILPVFVTGDDPANLIFTMMADQQPTAKPNLDTAAITDPARTEVRRQYATRAVMTRLHQQQFRRMVLRAYRERCTICQLKHLPLLDAAHILSDRDPRGEATVSNGLGMCKIHHSPYDANILGIDPNARVHIRVDILEEVDGPMLKHGLQEMDGRKLWLPHAAELKPNREFLAERFERFEAA